MAQLALSIFSNIPAVCWGKGKSRSSRHGLSLGNCRCKVQLRDPTSSRVAIVSIRSFGAVRVSVSVSVNVRWCRRDSSDHSCSWITSKALQLDKSPPRAGGQASRGARDHDPGSWEVWDTALESFARARQAQTSTPTWPGRNVPAWRRSVVQISTLSLFTLLSWLAYIFVAEPFPAAGKMHCSTPASVPEPPQFLRHRPGQT